MHSFHFTRPLFISSFLFLFAVTSFLTTLSFSAMDTFVLGGCSQLKYTPGTPYESNVNSLLLSLVNSASFTLYTNFTVQLAGPPTIYGLFQCRGDLSSSDCYRCVSRAVSELGTLCPDSTGGALQLEGCFVKYDNNTFLGVEDKTIVLKQCGPTVGFGSDELTRRDAVLDYLGAVAGAGGDAGGYKAYRVGVSGDVYAMAQCVQDLSMGQCQDCLAEATGRLKTDCGASAWGNMYLAKCYARFSVGGAQSSSSNGGNGNNDSNHNDDEIEKTLAILIGLIAGVAFLIVFLSFLRKVCERAGKGGK